MTETTSTMTAKDVAGEILPPKGDGRVGHRAFQILEKILKYKNDQGLMAKWHRCYELSKGRHWRNETKKATLVTANLLYSHRQRTVAMLTDNHPTFNTKRAGELPEGVEGVDILHHTASHWWGETEQQDEFETSVINGETNGICIEKIRFDPEAEYGIGEVVTEQVDSYHFGWFPCNKMSNQEADANCHFWPMTVREARRRWPDKAGEIVADKEWIEQLADNRSEVISPMSKQRAGYMTTFMGMVKNMLNNAEEGSEEDDDVLILECWVRDQSRKANGDMEEDLYPGNLRCVWTCNGGEVVLDDTLNPSINWEALKVEQARNTFLFDHFPFNVTVSVKDTKSPWGMTDYEQLEGLNQEFNKTLAQTGLMKDKLSKVNIINPKNSGVANSQFTNTYGVINPKNHMVAEAIRYMEVPQLPKDLPAVLDIYQGLFDRISGAFELEREQTGTGDVIAYKAIAAVLERAATLMRGKLRNYHRLIRNRGRMYISCAQNWYVQDRWVSYERGGIEEVLSINGRGLLIPGRIDVVSGSTMPVSKVQQREEALGLYDKGVIDQEELLKKMEWEDYRSVVERMKRGPVGLAMDRLVELGLTPEVAAYFVEVGVMEQNDFERAFQKGELPDVWTVLFPPEPGAEPEENPVENAEVALKQAQAEEVYTKIELIKAQIETENVEQQVKLAGVDFDKEKLAIERAQVVNSIRTTQAQDARDNLSTATGIEKDAAAEERSNKAEERSDRTEDRADKAEKREDVRLAAEIKTKEAEQKAQGPYREKGMKSNNKGKE